MADQYLAFGYTDHPENMPLIEFPLVDTAIDDLLYIITPHPLAIGALDDLELVDTLTWMDEDAQFILDFERSLDAEEAVMCGIEDDVPARIIAANDIPPFGAVVTCKDPSSTTSVLQLLVQSYHFIEDADTVNNSVTTMRGANAVLQKLSATRGSTTVIFLDHDVSAQSVALTIHPIERLSDQLCHPFSIDDMPLLTETLGTDIICFTPLPAADGGVVLFACAANAVNPALLFALGVRMDSTGIVGVMDILNVSNGTMTAADRAFFLDRDAPVVLVEEEEERPAMMMQECAMTPKKHDDGDVFEVDNILDKKIVDGMTYYLIEWNGCTMSDASWEPEHNVFFDAAAGIGTIICGTISCGVDGILKMAESDGVVKYLVKWTGYPLDEASWEDRENALEDEEDEDVV